MIKLLARTVTYTDFLTAAEAPFSKLFCVSVQNTSNQVEWTIIDTTSRSADYTSIVPPEGTLLDSTVKVVTLNKQTSERSFSHLLF